LRVWAFQHSRIPLFSFVEYPIDVFGFIAEVQRHGAIWLDCDFEILTHDGDVAAAWSVGLKLFHCPSPFSRSIRRNSRHGLQRFGGAKSRSA
jgi:hypothetical protein